MSAVEDRRRVLAAFGRRAGRLFKLAQRLQVSATKTYALKQDPFSHVHTLPLGFAMRLVRSARLSRISIHEPTTSYAPRRPAKRPRLSQRLAEQVKCTSTFTILLSTPEGLEVSHNANGRSMLMTPEVYYTIYSDKYSERVTASFGPSLWVVLAIF